MGGDGGSPVRLGALARRRSPGDGDQKRQHRVTVRFNEAEKKRLEKSAAAANLKLVTFIAIAALKSGPQVVADDSTSGRAEVLLAVLDLQRQLRGACRNWNQAVAKLHALGVPPDELWTSGERVRQIASQVDALVAGMAKRR